MLLLVFDLNYPFSGPVRVGPEAFELALARYANIRLAGRRDPRCG